MINPRPKIKIKRISQSISLVDANDSIGFVAADIAIKQAIKNAKKTGIGMVAVKNSGHYGLSGYYAEQAIKKNLITMIYTNAPPAVAPHGSLKSLFGTNPICFGTPTGSKVPFILDTSISMINRGKIRFADKNNQKIPVGVALDKFGRPTTNAKKALQGVQLPIANFKGSGLAWMVDILSGVLTGGNHAGRVKDPFDDFTGPQNIGHLFITFKTNLFVNNYNKRIKDNINKIKRLPKIKGVKEIVYPGQNKYKRFIMNSKKEIKISKIIKKDLELLKKVVMLSNKEIICPNNLLDVAHSKKGVKVAIVNAGKPLPMLSAQDAVNENLIEPVFIGDEKEILKCAEDLKWDISKYEIIHEPVENNTAAIAAKLAKEEKVKIIVKGHIHTDVLMKEVLKREYNLLGKTRLSHIWHMTLDKEDKPLIITDGALNVLPNVKTKMHILKNVINFSNRIGIERPKIAILSATEEVLDSITSSKEADELTKLAKKENLNADVFGPLAFDNSISKKSAAIKGIKNDVAGMADVLLVPNVETGNGLVKMLIYFCGACAAGVVVGGKVPVVITSRSDDAPARLASIAAAVVALD